MTNDRNVIAQLTKEIGNKKNKELGIGKIYISKVNDKNEFKPYKDVDNVFDEGSHNFHLVLQDEQILNNYCNHTREIRNKIVEELKKENGFKTINSNEYKKTAPINDYSEEKKYIYENGGKKGNLRALQNTKYSEQNYIFRYIPCMKNGIYYNLNFMRFYIDREANVNVIYNSYQFDASLSRYTNQNYIGYPTRYTKHTVNELKEFTHNIFFNPETNCLEIGKKYGEDDIDKHVKEIVEEFLQFIEICEKLRNDKLKPDFRCEKIINENNNIVEINDTECKKSEMECKGTLTNLEVDEELTNVCRFLFGEDEKLKELHQKALKYQREFEKYGKCEAGIKMMNYIREKMKELNLISKEVQSYNDWKNVRGNFFTEDFLKLALGKEDLNDEEIKEYMKADKDFSYDEDGWTDGYHYYNELDHYLTHMVGNMINQKGVSFSKEPGMKQIRENILKLMEQN